LCAGDHEEDGPQQELRHDQAEGHQAEEEGADRQLEGEGDVCRQEQVRFSPRHKQTVNWRERFVDKSR